MRGERGISLVELLVAAFGATVVLAGLLTMYLGATRVFGESTARIALQRQGTLVVDQIGRRARAASPPNAIALGCGGRAVSVRINTPPAPACYYAGGAGELCEDAGAGCRDLLAGALAGRMPGLTAIALARQASPPDPACPAEVPAGQRCFRVFPPGDTQARIAFAISDGLHTMAFEVSLTCAGRTCGQDLPL